MRKQFDRSLATTRFRRRGTTLIEVLAGLVILGTLLVSVAAARGRFLRQWAEADRRLAIVKATDAMMANWLAGPAQNVPLRGEGPLSGVSECVWRARIVPNPEARHLGAVVVRAEVFDRSVPGRREPLLGVEFLVHDFRKAPVQEGTTHGTR